MNISIYKIIMNDYEHYHYDKDLLKQSATQLGILEVNPIADLEQVRNMINKYVEDNPECSKLSSDWCFVDCKFSKELQLQ